MIKDKLKIYHTRLTGFTIVELLIVIVILGVLATISIVAYNGIQNRAQMTVKVSNVKTTEKQIEMFRIEHGTYPTSADMVNMDIGEGVIFRNDIYDDMDTGYDFRKDRTYISGYEWSDEWEDHNTVEVLYWDNYKGVWLVNYWEIELGSGDTESGTYPDYGSGPRPVYSG